ncbi:type IX secretion system outer membrane channel protein PorV [uncultured Imperialibacter sp.]|uniref:type IX secretion system outer membrane channel protein PorV n=1 Tax=uncultured Imperialibacter sp. TaxID=1672639 RepID=UPI0030D8E976
MKIHTIEKPSLNSSRHVNAGVFVAFGLIFLSFCSYAQPGAVISGQDTSRRVISTAVPFLGFAPDARGAAMGDVGVATSTDANSVHWNNGKLAFIEQDMGFAISYTPWLAKIVNDMSLSYLSGYKKIDRVQAVALSMRYFDLGEIQLTDNTGAPLNTFNPREFAVDATYSRKLSEELGLGVTGRFIHSNLSGSFSSSPDAKAGTSVAVDVGSYYTKDLVLSGRNSNISAGAHISNIGQKLTYSSVDNEDFIPINLRLGAAFKTDLDAFNTITVALDFNKLMVPSPPIYETDGDGNFIADPNDPSKYKIKSGKDPYRPLLSGMFGSFGDAPDGFPEELNEIISSIGVEYWYKDVFAARAGYHYETPQKGDRKYFTMGIGFRYQVFGIDFAYLVPQVQNHPLAETLRFSLLFNFDKATPTSTTPDS